MKSLKILALGVLLFSCKLCFCQEKQEMHSTTKTLVIYLSRTHNTEVMAKRIQNLVGGDLVALTLQKPYPKDYEAHVAQVAKENETGYLPQLKTTLNLAKYDTIFIGFPTWGMQLPPPIKSFLHTYNTANKTLIPFNTHAGFGVGSGFTTVQQMASAKATVLEGLSVKGGYEKHGVYLVFKDDKITELDKKLKAWLKQLQIL